MPIQTSPETLIRPIHRGRPRVSTPAKIEAAAVKLFQENGYQQTTIQEVADQAGVSRSTVFRYVNTKDQLLWIFQSDYAAVVENSLLEPAEKSELIQRVQSALINMATLEVDSSQILRAKLKLIQSEKDQLFSLAQNKEWVAKKISDFLRRNNPKLENQAWVNGIGHAFVATLYEVFFQWAEGTGDRSELAGRLEQTFTPITSAFTEYFHQYL